MYIFAFNASEIQVHLKWGRLEITLCKIVVMFGGH
jgi:hypothetical protein